MDAREQNGVINMRQASRDRLIVVLTDAMTDGNYTIEFHEWAKEQLRRVRIGVKMQRLDLSFNLSCILSDASMNYRYDRETRDWARRTGKRWREGKSIRGW